MTMPLVKKETRRFRTSKRGEGEGRTQRGRSRIAGAETSNRRRHNADYFVTQQGASCDIDIAQPTPHALITAPGFTGRSSGIHQKLTILLPRAPSPTFLDIGC